MGLCYDGDARGRIRARYPSLVGGVEDQEQEQQQEGMNRSGAEEKERERENARVILVLRMFQVR